MHQPQAFDAVWRTPAAQALALKLVTEADLLRLKVIARLHARGLPPEIDWSDLLQDAFARVLDGSRRQPDGLPMVIFLAGVMRSMKTEHWRRAREKARQLPKLLAELEAVDAPGGEPRDPAPDPERSLIAIQELIAITQLFAEDAQARRVIAGLAEERSTRSAPTERRCTAVDVGPESCRHQGHRVRRPALAIQHGVPARPRAGLKALRSVPRVLWHRLERQRLRLNRSRSPIMIRASGGGSVLAAREEAGK